MPSTINGSDSYPASLTIPSDGDARNAASVDGAFSALADRTTYAKARLDEGVRTIKHYADAATLRAETVHLDGSVAALNAGSSGALYTYDAASVRADDGILTIKPTDVGAGAGRWLHPAVKALASNVNVTGAWAFAADLTASLNINCAGDVNANGALFASGSCTVGSLVCSGAGSFSAGLTVSGGSGLQVTGGAGCALSGTLGVSGSATFGSSITVTGATTCAGILGVSGLATFGGGVAINGASTLTKPVASTSTGRISHRVIDGSTSPATYGINDADEIQVAGLIGDIGYSLSTAGAQDGDRIRFVATDATHTVTISGGGEAGFAIKAASGSYVGIEYVFKGTTWRRSIRIPFDA